MLCAVGTQCSLSSAFPSLVPSSIFEHGDSLRGNEMTGFTFWMCIESLAPALISVASVRINMMSDHKVCRNSKNESNALLVNLRKART
jgi:hypothetical protein